MNVESIETKPGVKSDLKLLKSNMKITDSLVKKLITDSQTNKIRDEAELTIAEADLRVQNDQLKNQINADTKRIEELISSLGISLIDNDNISIGLKTKDLRNLLESSSSASYPFGGIGFGDLFEGFFSPTSSVKRSTTQKHPKPMPENQTPKVSTTPTIIPLTPITAIIQNFLEQVSPDLESKRCGAWQALESGSQDGPSQASHSMREVLRQLLDTLAPESVVQNASWYKKPKTGTPVTRAMRLRYAISGSSELESESTVSFIDGMAEAVKSMYAKLSAESHSHGRLKVSTVRMYLNACEALIGLIANERKL